MLVVAVGCRLGSMLLSTIHAEVGQQVTLEHVIAAWAGFALALVAVPFFVLALVYGVLHLVRGRQPSGEDTQADEDVPCGPTVKVELPDGLLLQATVDGDLHWVWAPELGYWVGARQAQNTVSVHPIVTPDGSVRMSGFYGFGRLPTRDTALDRWAVAVKQETPELEGIAARVRPETVEFICSRTVKRTCYWPRETASVHPDPDAVASVSSGWSGNTRGKRCGGVHEGWMVRVRVTGLCPVSALSRPASRRVFAGCRSAECWAYHRLCRPDRAGRQVDVPAGLGALH
jgi:hypothetical protein